MRKVNTNDMTEVSWFSPKGKFGGAGKEISEELRRRPQSTDLKEGTTPIETGDAFIFEPGQPHQLTNDGSEDLVIYVVADNPLGESRHCPDSQKWTARSPEGRLIRSDPLDYYDGEE